MTDYRDEVQPYRLAPLLPTPARVQLYRDLAWVVRCEREAIEQPYAWPPRGRLTAVEAARVARLEEAEEWYAQRAREVAESAVADFRRRAHARIHEAGHEA